MLLGPSIAAAEFPKAASRWLAAVLIRSGLAERVAGMATHGGLWDLEHGDRVRLAAVRDPVTWHLSHAHHWIRSDGTPGPVLAPWVSGCPDDPVVRAAVLAMAAPELSGVDLDTRPQAMAWPQPDAAIPARWCAERECGLMTWGWVRTVYPRATWHLSIDELRGTPILADEVIRAEHAAPDLASVAERHGWAIDTSAPPVGPSAWTGDPAGYLTPEDVELIRHRERLLLQWA